MKTGLPLLSPLVFSLFACAGASAPPPAPPVTPSATALSADAHQGAMAPPAPTGGASPARADDEKDESVLELPVGR